MKIIHVVPAFIPAIGYGGGPTVAHELARVQVQQGHDVCVFTTDANDQSSRLPAGFTHTDGIRVHYLRNLNNHLAYRYKLFLAPALLWAFRRELHGCDIVHMHDLRTFLNVVAYGYAKGSVPYVLQAHGVLPTSGRLGRWKSYFDRLIGYRIVKDAARLLALNQREAKAYTDMDADIAKIRIVPNGIDRNKYKALPERGHFRRKYDLGDLPVVFYLGRIHESKGLVFLLHAFTNLLEKVGTARLVIAGFDDGYLPRLNEIVEMLELEDRVIFCGYLSGDNKLAAFRDADVFVTPKFTGFPLTFLEAMTCGLPIVMTDAGDTLNGIDGEAGVVVRYDIEQFGDALAKILLDSRVREKLHRGAEQFALRHDWQRVAENIGMAYQEALEVVREGLHCRRS